MQNALILDKLTDLSFTGNDLQRTGENEVWAELRSIGGSTFRNPIPALRPHVFQIPQTSDGITDDCRRNAKMLFDIRNQLSRASHGVRD